MLPGKLCLGMAAGVKKRCAVWLKACQQIRFSKTHMRFDMACFPGHRSFSFIWMLIDDYLEDFEKTDGV